MMNARIPMGRIRRRTYPETVPSHSHPRESLPASGTRSFPLRLVIALCALAAPVFLRASEGPTVDVASGALRGSSLDGGGASFLGVPFAAPPLGSLRWRAPVAPAPWTGVREALKPGAPAPQPDLGWNSAMAAASSEDCLYLDVWTPDLKPSRPLPVMVWFHGGGNVGGSAGFDPAYDGRALIRHGVILVVAEYRMGILGFLALPELDRESPHGASGNYATLDQIEALKWVHANIAAFGGDPSNVTLFGQSAGATDVVSLLATPLSRGLFQKAIAESGVPAREQTRTRAEAEASGHALARSLGVPDDGLLAALRALPVSRLEALNPQPSTFTVDGWVFPKSPYEAFRGGESHRVPLIIGSNAVEFPGPSDPVALRAAITRVLGTRAARQIALYGIAPGAVPPPEDPVYGSPADQWGSDAWRVLSVVHGEWQSRTGEPVWEYEFDRGIPPAPRAVHSGDLPYVFGNLDAKSGNLAGAYTQVDRSLSDAVMTYWTRFAKTGSPNGPGLPAWPAYTASGRAFMRFTVDGRLSPEADERGPYLVGLREAASEP